MFRRNDCAKTRELLSPYLDEHLDPLQKPKIEAHLEACEACRHEWESLRATVAILRQTPTITPPRSFTLRSPAVKRPVWQGTAILPWSTAIAAVLLLVVLAGDGLSSFTVGGSSASAPLLAPVTRENGASAPSTATKDVASPPVLRSSGSEVQGQATTTPPVTPGPLKAGSADVRPGDSVTPPATSADAGAPSAGLLAGAVGGVGPTGVPDQSGLTPTAFRMAEIGLAFLITILALAGVGLRRIRNRL